MGYTRVPMSSTIKASPAGLVPSSVVFCVSLVISWYCSFKKSLEKETLKSEMMKTVFDLILGNPHFFSTTKEPVTCDHANNLNAKEASSLFRCFSALASASFCRIWWCWLIRDSWWFLGSPPRKWGRILLLLPRSVAFYKWKKPVD